jgi:hypothetical protein
MGDVEFVEQVVDQGLLAVFALLDEFDHRAKVLLDRQATEDRRLLREIAEAKTRALIHGQARDVVTIDRDLAEIGRDEPRDHVKAGRLAGAVRPQKPDHLAAAHAHRHAAHDGAPLEGLAEIFSEEPAAALDDHRSLRGALHGRAGRCGFKIHGFWHLAGLLFKT